MHVKNRAEPQIYEPVLITKLSEKNKSPRLLFNTSIHSRPIKIVRIDEATRITHLAVKNRVTAVLGRPKWHGDGGHHNSKKHVKTLWRVLLDSGSDGDILFQPKSKNKNKSVPYTRRLTPQIWQTSTGKFSTEKVGDFVLTFPEYSGSKRISLRPDIMEYDPKNYDPKFDLIIGTNTMRELGIVLDFSRDMIMIDKIDLPMRRIDEIQKPNKLYQMYKNTEPDSTKELTKRALRILDAKYEKADLPAIVSTCDHLNESQKEKLLQVLEKFETLFDGTLGDWNTDPVHFEFKDGAKPYHGRPFPVPRIHRETMKKEVDRMVKLGIMKWEGESEWAFPSFIIPKSNQTVRFISDFR